MSPVKRKSGFGEDTATPADSLKLRTQLNFIRSPIETVPADAPADVSLAPPVEAELSDIERLPDVPDTPPRHEVLSPDTPPKTEPSFTSRESPKVSSRPDIETSEDMLNKSKPSVLVPETPPSQTSFTSSDNLEKSDGGVIPETPEDSPVSSRSDIETSEDMLNKSKPSVLVPDTPPSQTSFTSSDNIEKSDGISVIPETPRESPVSSRPEIEAELSDIERLPDVPDTPTRHEVLSPDTPPKTEPSFTSRESPKVSSRPDIETSQDMLNKSKPSVLVPETPPSQTSFTSSDNLEKSDGGVIPETPEESPVSSKPEIGTSKDMLNKSKPSLHDEGSRMTLRPRDERKIKTFSDSWECGSITGISERDFVSPEVEISHHTSQPELKTDINSPLFKTPSAPQFGSTATSPRKTSLPSNDDVHMSDDENFVASVQESPKESSQLDMETPEDMLNKSETSLPDEESRMKLRSRSERKIKTFSDSWECGSNIGVSERESSQSLLNNDVNIPLSQTPITTQFESKAKPPSDPPSEPSNDSSDDEWIRHSRKKKVKRLKSESDSSQPDVDISIHALQPDSNTDVNSPVFHTYTTPQFGSKATPPGEPPSEPSNADSSPLFQTPTTPIFGSKAMPPSGPPSDPPSEPSDDDDPEWMSGSRKRKLSEVSDDSSDDEWISDSGKKKLKRPKSRRKVRRKIEFALPPSTDDDSSDTDDNESSARYNAGEYDELISVMTGCDPSIEFVEYNVKKQNFQYKVDSSLWEDLTTNCLSDTGRGFQLGSWFSRLLEPEITKYNPYCVWKIIRHQISKPNIGRSKPTNSTWFRATLECKFDDCGMVAKAKMFVLYQMKVTFTKPSIRHKAGQMRSRYITGDDRKKIMAEFKKGVTPSSLYKEILAGKPLKCLNAGNFSGIGASGLKVFDKMSSDARTSCRKDGNLTTNLQDLKDKWIENDTESEIIKGFIHDMETKNPLLIHYYSEKSIIIFNALSKKDCLFFYATGSVAHVPGSSERLLYYELTARNPREGTPSFPLFGMLSQSQTAVKIASGLSEFLDAYKKKYGHQVIVIQVNCDWSMAVITGVMMAFCRHQLIDYLNRAWRVIKGTASLKDLSDTVVHICKGHSMNSYKRKMVVCYKRNIVFGMYCFSLIINTDSWIECLQIINSFFVVLVSTYETRMCQRATNFLENKMKRLGSKSTYQEQEKEWTKLEENLRGTDDEEPAVNPALYDESDYVNQCPTSKFRTTCENMLANIRKKVEREESGLDVNSGIPNRRKSEQLLTYFIRYCAPILPLFTHILTGDIRRHNYAYLECTTPYSKINADTQFRNCKTSPADNTSFIEQRFTQLKKHRLKYKEKLRPDDFSRELRDDFNECQKAAVYLMWKSPHKYKRKTRTMKETYGKKGRQKGKFNYLGKFQQPPKGPLPGTSGTPKTPTAKTPKTQPKGKTPKNSVTPKKGATRKTSKPQKAENNPKTTQTFKQQRMDIGRHGNQQLVSELDKQFLVGIPNPNMTSCYFNALVQALSCSQHSWLLIHADQYIAANDREFSTRQLLAEVFHDVKVKGPQSVSEFTILSLLNEANLSTIPDQFNFNNQQCIDEAYTQIFAPILENAPYNIKIAVSRNDKPPNNGDVCLMVPGR